MGTERKFNLKKEPGQQPTRRQGEEKTGQCREESQVGIFNQRDFHDLTRSCPDRSKQNILLDPHKFAVDHGASEDDKSGQNAEECQKSYDQSDLGKQGIDRIQHQAKIDKGNIRKVHHQLLLKETAFLLIVHPGGGYPDLRGFLQYSFWKYKNEIRRVLGPVYFANTIDVRLDQNTLYVKDQRISNFQSHCLMH